MKPDIASHSLEGRRIKDTWQVTKKLPKNLGSTGGFFSVCYLVNDGKREAFLKALNFNAFFDIFRGMSIVDIINEQTKAFQFEKELLLKCKNNRLTKVAIIIDEGEEYLSGFTIGNVPYLIFEMANGDIRSQINFSNQMDLVSKLNSLHNVAVGLKQLHSLKIGHQDLKPSNVLLYENGTISKIGDLGRSLCADIIAPHDNGGNFPGDFTYAPPEFLYQYIEPEWSLRVKATDFYLFGSLVVFYFTGTNMTALIGKNIDPRFKWDVFQGSYLDVKDYLVDAFYKALSEFKISLNNKDLSDELVPILEYCCFPYPSKRGNYNKSNLIINQFDFQRLVSKFDILAKRYLYKIK